MTKQNHCNSNCLEMSYNKIKMPASAHLDYLLYPPTPGAGGHNKWSNSALKGIPYFISPLY